MFARDVGHTTLFQIVSLALTTHSTFLFNPRCLDVGLPLALCYSSVPKHKLIQFNSIQFNFDSGTSSHNHNQTDSAKSSNDKSETDEGPQRTSKRSRRSEDTIQPKDVQMDPKFNNYNQVCYQPANNGQNANYPTNPLVNRMLKNRFHDSATVDRR